MDKFYQQLGTARWRTARLYHGARKSFVQQQELLAEGFEELNVALEDLEVAQEELCQQNSELAAAHEVLVMERQRYQNLFNFAPDAYLVTDKYGTICEANRAAAQLLNVPQRFLVGKPLVIFACLEELRAFCSKLAKLHSCQYQRQEWEVRLQPRGGAPIDAIMTVGSVHAEGSSIALGWLIRDITERKRTQQPLSLLRSAVQPANEAINLTQGQAGS